MRTGSHSLASQWNCQNTVCDLPASILPEVTTQHIQSWALLGETCLREPPKPCVLAHTCNASPQEAEPGGPQVHQHLAA